MSDPHVTGTEPWVNVLGSRNFLDWRFEQAAAHVALSSPRESGEADLPGLPAWADRADAAAYVSPRMCRTSET